MTTPRQMNGADVTGALGYAPLASTGDASATKRLPPVSGSVLRTIAAGAADRMSVLDFGILGNGSDEAALYLAALTACAGRCELLHPAGLTVTIGSQVNIPANTTLTLHGTVIALGDSRLLFNLLDLRAGNITIQGHGLGKVDGNRANRNAPGTGGIGGGITSGGAAGVDNAHITGIEVLNCPHFPVNLTNAVTNSKVEYCTLHDSGNSAEFSGATNCHFYRCTVYNINDDGLVLYAGCSKCSITYCTVHDCTTGPMILADVSQPAPCDGCLLAYNTAYNNALNGVSISSTTTPHTNCDAIGNIANGNGGLTHSTVSNILISGLHHGLVSNNQAVGVVASNSAFGILLQNDNQFVKVVHNTVGNCSGPTANGIQMSQTGGTSVGMDISENTVLDNQAVATTRVAILVACMTTAEAHGVTVRNNKMTATSGTFLTTSFSDAGNLGVAFEGEHAFNNTENLKTYTQGLQVPTLQIGGAAGPSFIVVTGAPTVSAKKNTLAFRTDGTAGTNIYVNQNGATTWLPIAGV